MPASASASFSSISSVVSDFTFTTSAAPCARATSSDDGVRLGRVGRPVHVPAGRRHRRLELHQVLVEVGEHVRLDRAAGLAQLLPVGQLADHAGALGPDRVGRVAEVRCAAARSASSRLAALGNASMLTR